MNNIVIDPPIPTYTLRLADGRQLAYTDYGDPAGQPLLLFHGLPGSRWQRHPDLSIASELGVRLITPDRPGIGLSDYQPRRTLLDWPVDVQALVNHLGFKHFMALGISGGGPYAAACAYRMPERLIRVGIVSGLGTGRLDGMKHSARLLFTLARWGDWATYLPGATMAWLARHRLKLYLRVLFALLPPVDRRIVSQPAIQAVIQEDIATAFQQGYRGPASDLAVLAKPWAFSPTAIQVPVYLWHGEQDKTVPVYMGRELAAQLPNCQAQFLPAAGHFFIFERWREIITELLA